jgi:phospholipase/carboxylesterase
MRKIGLFFLLLVFSFVGFSQKIKTQLNYLVKEPAGVNNNTPVLIMLHGYSSNEADLFSLVESIDSRFIVFSLRAPNTISAGRFAWYPMEFLPDQKFKYDYAKIKESKEKILAFIRSACAAYHVDSTQVFLLGFSQGAIMSYELALSNPKKITGVMALSGRMLEETKKLKINWPAAEKVKFFVGHGVSDNVIKISDAENAVKFLKAKRIDVTYKSYPAVHTITSTELIELNAWLTGAVRSKSDSKKKVL